MIIALSTAHLNDKIRQRCLAAGMVSTFLKLFDAQKMQEIWNLLNGDQQHQGCQTNQTHLSTWGTRRYG